MLSQGSPPFGGVCHLSISLSPYLSLPHTQTHTHTHTHGANSPSSTALSGEQRGLSYDSAPTGQGPDIRGQHPPLVKGEPHFYQKLILGFASSPPSEKKKKKKREMILTTWMVQYSFWKLKGPNSPSTGVHVGREGAWSRAALGPMGNSNGVEIQKAEARILRVGGWNSRKGRE